jgi:hypothetical protein
MRESLDDAGKRAARIGIAVLVAVVAATIVLAVLLST